MILMSRLNVIFISLSIVSFLSFCSPYRPAISTYLTIATLQSFSTPQSVVGYPAQVTDGKLLLSVEEYQPRCYKLGVPRKLRFTFTNLTDNPIKFISDLDIAMNRRWEGGNISVFITDENGKDLYTLEDSAIVDYFHVPDRTYTEFHSNQSVDFFLDFYFPSLFSDPTKRDHPTSEPWSGKYYIRFLYFGFDQDSAIWQGAISSNNLEICLSN